MGFVSVARIPLLTCPLKGKESLWRRCARVTPRTPSLERNTTLRAYPQHRLLCELLPVRHPDLTNGDLALCAVRVNQLQHPGRLVLNHSSIGSILPGRLQYSEAVGKARCHDASDELLPLFRGHHAARIR